MLFRMVSKAYIPSLIAIGDVVPNGTKMVPNLVWLIFLLFSTAFSCNIFRLDQHRKILFSKSADFVIFSDITNKMANASDILYISTALILPQWEDTCTEYSYDIFGSKFKFLGNLLDIIELNHIFQYY